MNLVIQILAIIGMFFLSYLGLLAFGKPSTKLVYDAEEKLKWDAIIKEKFGDWLTGTNIVGTLTSFATVLVFFMGNAKVFGLWVLVCSISIWFGGFFTNYFTGRVVSVKRIKDLIDSPKQTGGVLASLCWDKSKTGVNSSRIVKYISLANIAAVIWLEFALFSDIGGDILGFSSISSKSIMLAAASFAVFYFVFKFGIRGFAFTDIFQTPIIGICTILIAAGSFWLFRSNISSVVISDIISPIVDSKTITLFVVHVIFLNIFLVLATEPHWLRLWMFKAKESERQLLSTFSTALIWAFLVGIGFIASALGGGGAGTQVIVNLASQLSNLTSVFIVAFWFAAVAALFTTADAQTYSWLVVANYDPVNGEVSDMKLGGVRPLFYAAVATIIFVIAYTVVRSFNIPFEKLVFLIIPFSLNTLPAIIQLSFKRQPSPALMVISVIFFVGFGAGGFLQTSSELAWTLSAALVPVLVSFASPFVGDKIEE